ncbi:helix-turn-helix domain-containing protein [Snuella lapsa]|uniref:HTH araC/xylS-type domain-containing protein n=1 Tax=Snuella lapsa TaxID=870481 RepID=A0ABP6WMX5_9FLAO
MRYTPNIKIKHLCLLIAVFLILQAFHGNYAQDSLSNKSYQELSKLSDDAFYNGDLERLSIYRTYYLDKAKTENNNLEMARAYQYFITWEDLETDLKYCDSVIKVTKDSDHEAYPTNGYLLKANMYYYGSDFEKALDNYIIASEWADAKGYKPLQIEASMGIAAIKNIWGLHEEALEIYKTNYLDVTSTTDYMADRYEDYILFANNLALSYIRNQKPDSALVVSSRAMSHARSVNDSLSYYDLGKVQATANYYLKKYPQTQDSLLKFLSHYSGLTRSDSYYMLGKIADYQNDHALKMDYFKRIDSIHQTIGDPFPELKEVYNELYKDAGNKGDKDRQLYYIDQLIAVDSTLDINYATVNNKVRLEYDIPRYKKEKRLLTTELKNKRQQLQILTIVSFIILAILLVYINHRHRKFKKRLQQLLDNDPVETTEPKPKKEKPALDISEHIINTVLEQLKQFEADKAYLDKDITLSSLAKDFNTNSSYMSNIINHYKQMNFSSYLKDLRITYAINSIKKDHQYLKYSINGLADEFGFITADSFSKAFREKTGIKPSYFLGKLREENNT